MALIKCPDCGKEVSSRAKMCPNCGCPIKFMVTDECTETEDNSAESVNNKFSSKEYMAVTNKQTIKFKIANYILEYEAETEDFASLYGTYMQAADMAYNEMRKLYKEAGSIGKALERLPDKANQLIDAIIDEGTKYLYNHGIPITPEQFVAKYNSSYTMNYSVYYDVTLEKYADILGKKKEMASYRAATQASRGRWVGGGFGVKGAVRGAVTASAMNLGSDFIHSFGDSAREKKDNQAIQSEMNRLYKNSEAQLCHSVKTCILNVYEAMVQEMNKNKLFKKTIYLDKEKADTLYENTKNYETEPNIIIKNMVNCILYYPGERRFYMEIKDKLFDPNSEIGNFLRFWHLEYLLSDLTEQEENRAAFEQFMLKCGVSDFDFQDFSAENAALMWYWLGEYQNEIPVDNHGLGEKTKNYLVEFTHHTNECYKEILADYFSLSITEEEFFRIVYRNEKYSYYHSLREFWNPKNRHGIEPTEKIFALYETDGDRIKLYCDTSITEMGGKGIAITSKYVIDLKTKTKLDIVKISDISVAKKGDENYELQFSDGNQVISFNNQYIKENDVTAWYVRDVTKIYFIRFCGNSILQRDKDYTITKVRQQAEQNVNKKNEEVQKVQEEANKRESEANEHRKIQYIKLLKKFLNKQSDFDIASSLLFRKRFKYAYEKCKGINDEKLIDKYDFELENGELKAIFNSIGICGQYILYVQEKDKFNYHNTISILTDRYIYIIEGKDLEHPNKISRECLNNINEVIFHSGEYLMSSELDETRIILKKNMEIDIPSLREFTSIANPLNVALEPFREKDYAPFYGKYWYYCHRCNSKQLKKTLTGKYVCPNCGKKYVNDIFWIGTYESDNVASISSELDAYFKTGDEPPYDLWKDENMARKWLQEDGILPYEEQASEIENTSGTEKNDPIGNEKNKSNNQ